MNIEIIDKEITGIDTICCLCGYVLHQWENQRIVLVDRIAHRACNKCAQEIIKSKKLPEKVFIREIGIEEIS